MMRERTCPLCGGSGPIAPFAEARFDPARLDEFAFASRKVPEYMCHRLLVCTTCDMIYASPVPEVSELESAYCAAAFDSGAESARAACTYLDALQPLLARLPERRGALDIGSGDGALLQALSSTGFADLHGIEPSAAPLAAAPPEIRKLIVQGLFGPGQFPPESLLLVTCFQTIEHVEDPLGLCREAYQLLKPGGALCLVGHNRRALSAKLLRRWSPIFDIEHLQLFSPRSLKGLLSRAGFESITVRPMWNRYPLSYWTRLFPLPRGLKKLVLWGQDVSRLGRIPVALPAGNLLAFGFKRNAARRSPREEARTEKRRGSPP